MLAARLGAGHPPAPKREAKAKREAQSKKKTSTHAAKRGSPNPPEANTVPALDVARVSRRAVSPFVATYLVAIPAPSL